MPVDLFGYGYAAAVALGGVAGYVKAGSVMSLGAGLLFGGVLAEGARQVSADPSSCHLSLATSSFLAALMGYRFINSGKVMPAGMVAALSLVFAVRYGSRLVYGSKW